MSLARCIPRAMSIVSVAAAPFLHEADHSRSTAQNDHRGTL
jgi:hypothetical protein